MLVPKEVLKNIKCSYCHNYLSVFPIYEQNGTYRCGRCAPLELINPSDRKSSSIRQELYEKLAASVNFPCQHEGNGCMEKLVPGKLQAHETACQYKPFDCVSLPQGQCTWKGQAYEMLEHFRECHEAQVLNNMEIELSLVNEYENNYVFMFEGETFVALLKCTPDRDEFSCTVKYIGPASISESFSYQVSLVNERSQIYELVVRRVQMDRLDFHAQNNMTFVDITNIQLNLNKPAYVILNLKLMKEHMAAKTAPSKKQQGQVMDESLLQSFECPVCFLYMIPPIMQCVMGHSICHTCKEKISACPSCKSEMGDIRNYTLENFVCHIPYPCRYREFDCEYYGKPSEIKGHESVCKFGPFDCPILGCAWKGKHSSLMEHVRDTHEEEYLDIDTVNFVYSQEQAEESTYIIEAYGDVFKLEFEYDEDNFLWAMQFVGPTEDSCKYTYELSFVAEGSPERIFIRGRCGPLTSTEHCFSDSMPYVKLGRNMVEAIIKDNILKYSVHITLHDHADEAN